MLKKPKVSIIIVHYRNKKALFSCLNSIERYKPKVSFEVIVVDNDEKKSIEKSLKRKFPRVTYFKAPGNIGYASGNNLGSGKANGDYLFILNPDTKVLSGSFDYLVRFIESKKRVGIIAPTLIDRNSNIYPLQGTKKLTPLRGIIALSFFNKLFPNNSVSKEYWLKNISKEKVHEVDVVPGSAFLIKKKLFEEVGGFDEKFFLYFEESDLCKRVKETGHRIYMIPQAKIIHTWGGTTPKSEKINEIFVKSRFYYFKKHYGFLSALLVEGFLRINKWTIILGLILFIGTFLRFYRIEENLIFHGELGVDYLAVRDIIEGKRTALLGPRTSHEWLYLAPLFYWILAMLLPLFNYQPVAVAYFFAAVGVFAIYICYKVVSAFLGRNTGLISSYLLAISPAWVKLTRDSRFNAIAALLFFPFLYFLVKSIDDKGKGLFWLGIILGLSYSFFPTIIVLLPSLFILILMKRRNIKLKSLGKGLTGLLIPLIPFLIYNIQNKFDMIFKLLAWVPYRVAGFFGFYPKNTANLNIIKANFASIYTFFSESFFPDKNIVSFVLFLILIGYIGYNYFSQRKNVRSFWIVLTTVFAVTFIGLFLHGDPPKHYYLAIFPVPIIILSEFITRISAKKIGLVLSVIILLIISFINLKYYFSEKWFYQPQKYVVKGTLPVPFKLQLKIVDKIIEESGGRKFELKRVGPLQYFKADFSENYIYLFKRLGREPVTNANLTYTIYENTENLPYGKTFWIGNIAILEEEK